MYDSNHIDENTSVAADYLENLTALERQDLTKRILTQISNNLEQILQPEKKI